MTSRTEAQPGRWQGFVAARLAREVLLRRSPLGPGGWLFFLVTCGRWR